MKVEIEIENEVEAEELITRIVYVDCAEGGNRWEELHSLTRRTCLEIGKPFGINEEAIKAILERHFEFDREEGED